MKAAYIEQYGGSDEFKVGELEQPAIGADDVLIEVHAASVNPVDWKLREGYLKEMLHFEMPLVIGWDVSGVIKEVGANVTELDVGMKYSVVPILHDKAHMPSTSQSMRISSSKNQLH